MMEYIIRELRMDEVPLLNDFLYEAIYIPFGGALPPRSIILNENLQIYVRDFGTQPDDKCLVVEIGGQVVGAVWSRIMNDYGHVADDVPSLAISLYKEFRNHGIGSELLGQMLQLLRRDGYHKVSLSVQKENYAVGMYLKAGFQVWEETSEEYIMTYNLDL
jgi:ribosomal protein S18 acetylase RimI-like enzyme